MYNSEFSGVDVQPTATMPPFAPCNAGGYVRANSPALATTPGLVLDTGATLRRKSSVQASKGLWPSAGMASPDILNLTAFGNCCGFA